MSAPITKDQLTFSLGNLSYIDANYDAQPETPAVLPKRSVFARLHEWRQRRGVAAELAQMTDRELADIGLSRADVSRVFDPGFAAEHTHGRDYIAF
jgi:uncharacterized protein YjiS (DUF1127 family)